MSWSGFYPEHPCKSCGKILQGQDSGYPAELYAGICYSCTNAADTLKSKQMVDGAEWWDTAPTYSNRRERERYVFYHDCTKCNKGKEYVSRDFGSGGPYYRNCYDCLNRYFNHPVRLSYDLSCRKIRTIIYSIATLKNNKTKFNKYYKNTRKFQIK